jgi:crossover junction endodeoxyribonuclease RusA
VRADLVPIFTLPYPPSANRYWRNVKGRMVLSADARQYKHDAALYARDQRVTEPATGPLAVALVFYRPRKSGDLDNRIKVCLDALNGIAWSDDDQVVELHAYRRDDKAEPRVTVSVSVSQLTEGAAPKEQGAER